MTDHVLTQRVRPSTCGECPRLITSYVPPLEIYRGNRHTPTDAADIVFLMTQPDVDRDRHGGPVSLPGITGDRRSVFLRALHRMHGEVQNSATKSVVGLFAAACTPLSEREKPRLSVLNACHPHVREQLAALGTPLVVAFGSESLKQLGIARSHADVRGRILEAYETGLPEGVGVLVTFSDAAVAAAPGLYRTFEQDLRNGYAWLARRDAGELVTRRSVDEKFKRLVAGHKFASTIDEAIAICDEIVAYEEILPDGRKGPGTIAIDTETTSLSADKEGAKLIAFCFSWGEGLSTAFAFDHPFADPEYLERLPELKAAVQRVLDCPRPKTLHNAKFDLKWIELAYDMPIRNVAWCTMCGEHLIDEDKKGYYGLKSLTTTWLPDLSGYEDQLAEHVPARSDENEVSWARAMADHPLATAVPRLPEALRDHADRLEQYAAACQEYGSRAAAHQMQLLAWRDRKAAHRAAVSAYEARLAAAPRPRKPKAPTRASSDAERAAYVHDLQAYDTALAAHLAARATDPGTFAEKAPAAPSRAAITGGPRPVPPPLPADLEGAVKASQDAGFEYIPMGVLCQYGAIDTDVTRRLARLQGRHLIREAVEYAKKNSAIFQKGPLGLMASHVIPASRVLGRMEHTGIRIDRSYADRLLEALTRLIDQAQADLIACVPGYRGPNGAAFSPSSDQHIADVLYVRGWVHPDGTSMDPVPCLDYTPLTHQMSTTAKALKPYLKYDDVPDPAKPGKTKPVAQHDSYFLDRLFILKKASKARNTFLRNVRALSARDGRVHTSFHIPGTGTGRTSSSNPNLQNIPSKLAGWSLKKLFVPDSDEFVLVNYDYKGAEVRVFTVYASDPALIKALNDGMDMHSFFASKVFRRPYEDYEARNSGDPLLDPAYCVLLNKERQQIKRVVFGILYGAGAKTIAEQCGSSEEEAQGVIDLLFQMFPSIKRYLETTKLEVELYGAVETVFGRRRRFPLASSRRHAARAVRQAGNFRIQSTSSDIVIGQLVEIDEMIRSDRTWPEWGIHTPLHVLGVKVFLTVHDSIVLQWPKKLLHALTPWLTYYGEHRVTEKCPWLPVPFKGDIEVGDSYGELMAIGDYVNKLPPDFFEIDEREQDFEAEVVLRADAFDDGA